MSDDTDKPSRAELLERIAHAMRSPLGVLSHSVQTMQDELGPQADSARYAALAGRALHRLEIMAERLSAAASVERGAIELYPQRIDLADFVRRQVEDATAIEGRREIAVEQDLQPADVRGDPDRLQRVIFELLLNALQHARHKVGVRVRSEAGQVRLAVEDDGDGVPEALREALFDRTPRSRSGLGLGLRTARALVAAHGGTLTLEPSSGGARFSVTLPAL